MSRPAHLAYAEDVVTGRVLASQAVIAQCQRSLDDHEEGEIAFELGGEMHRFVWREDAVAGRLRFIRDCPHVQGRWAAEGRRLELSPFQLYFVAEVYGWASPDNVRLRRFREAILFIARKNGKTLLCCTLGLHEIGFGDFGAEVYVVATVTDQAKKLWGDAKKMVEASPRLGKHFTATATAITGKRGAMMPLSKQSDHQDGFNPSLGLFDEAAAITDPNQIHVIESGMGARDGPLSLMITTAQPVRNTLFYKRYEIARRGLLDGSIAPSSFALLYELDRKEEKDDPKAWIKANPNIGVSVTRRSIAEALRKVEENPSDLGLTLCKTFNIWSQYETAWLPIEKWDACAGDAVREGPAYIGLDLAENRDLAAACVLWDNGGGRMSADWRFWTPRESLDLYPPDDRLVLEAAAKAGILELLDAPFVDTDLIYHWVREVYAVEEVRRIGVDPWHAKRLTTQLEDAGLPVLVVAQTAAMLSDPIKRVENAVVGAQLTHPGHNILSWMMMNVVCIPGMRGGVTLAKPVAEPHRKIDGIDAMVTAAACLDFSQGAFAITDLDLDDEEDEAFDDGDLLYA